MITKIFYINVDRRDDRRKYMELQCLRLGINYERWEGVDGGEGIFQQG